MMHIKQVLEELEQELLQKKELSRIYLNPQRRLFDLAFVVLLHKEGEGYQFKNTIACFYDPEMLAEWINSPRNPWTKKIDEKKEYGLGVSCFMFTMQLIEHNNSVNLASLGVNWCDRSNSSNTQSSNLWEGTSCLFRDISPDWGVGNRQEIESQNIFSRMYIVKPAYRFAYGKDRKAMKNVLGERLTEPSQTWDAIAGFVDKDSAEVFVDTGYVQDFSNIIQRPLMIQRIELDYVVKDQEKSLAQHKLGDHVDEKGRN